MCEPYGYWLTSKFIIDKDRLSLPDNLRNSFNKPKLSINMNLRLSRSIAFNQHIVISQSVDVLKRKSKKTISARIKKLLK